MKLARLRAAGLQAHIGLARLGWLNSAVCALILLGLCAWWWGISYLRIHTVASLRALEQARNSLQQTKKDRIYPGPSIPQQRLAAFYDALGDKHYAEQQIKTLFAIAGKNGLILSQAVYKSSLDRNSRTVTYQALLPVKGSYEAIRQFCEQTLLAIPFASLDEISFKRDAIASRALEAKLHFTFYLADPQMPVPATGQARPGAVLKGEKS